ncbi:RNA-binding protein [Candidatus Woesearchaeota archaeon]|nr:RNA-binding protein [Candidatus Woesearchaeota archaeon]
MKTKRLNKNELKELDSVLVREFGRSFFGRKDRVELSQEGLLTVNGSPCLFRLGEKWVPSLKALLEDNFLKKVVVDMPAVPFIAKGADLMRPGIVELDESIAKDELVAIVDETHRKPIAVGQTLLSGQEIKVQDKGKMVRNLHFVGDRLWNL